ncbi:MAG: efflux RND transporter periplasmic adaptor subunit [Gallionella sp.]|nr:efflux RND transporter periplasmic adaptor subunit [Gallionella sp.]
MASSHSSRRTWILRAFMWAAALIVLSGMAWWLMQPKPPVVSLLAVAPGDVEATVSNTRAGTVKACHRAKLAPPAGGQIAELRVKKGDRVKAGQVLLALWSKDLQAQATLAQQQLQTATLRVEEVCALAEVSSKNAERSRQLRERGFISPEGLERADAEARAKRASCRSVRGEIEQAHSRIAVAQAGLARMTLRAPFDGIVADISGELGEYATPSPPGIPTPPAIDLIDDSCLFVSAPIDEVDAAAVKVALPARITLDAIKDRTFEGRVKRIAPYVLDLEKQARTVEVEVDFVEPPSAETLLVGYSADVEIIHTVRKNVLRIPTQSLLEGKVVLRYQPEKGTLESRPVKTGLANWEYTEILSGLVAGDRIVTALDQPGVKAGASVRPEAGNAAQ